jgi:hypothetical protein
VGGVAILVLLCGGARARAQQLSRDAVEQVRALMEEKAARTPRQRKIGSQLLYAAKQRGGARIAAGVPTLRVELVTDASQRVLVDVTATVTPSLLRAVAAAGGIVVNSFPQYRAVRAWLPLDRLEALAELAEVTTIRPADQGSHNMLTTSEGDVAHRADQVRVAFGVNGAGVNIGVLSDSVDHLATAQASGDVGPVTVLPGQSGVGACGGPCLGEGTAMLELISDLAPGASLFFATGRGGEANMATNIQALLAAGCDIIVDDVFYFAEAVFQDGIIAQAVDTVTAGGALYFSAAGNSGNKNDGTSGVWEGDFIDSGVDLFVNGTPVGRLHDFGGGTLVNTVTADGLAFLLQWSDALGASANDYDLYLINAALTTILAASTTDQTGSQDPFEGILSPGNDAGNHLMIVRVAGAGRFLHLSNLSGRLAVNTAGQTWGHATAAGAFGIAAVRAENLVAPFSGGAANPVETFSSDGPRRIFFLADGTAITPGNFSSSGGTVRPKPDLAAADCVMTSTPPFTPFCGTSAAAPHAAAIAALLKSAAPGLTSAQVRTALTSTALDIEAPGFDRDSGFGLIDAYAAVDTVADPTPSSTPTITPTPSATATPSATPTPSRTPTPTITNTPSPLVTDDIDGDGETEPLTDGLLKLRWLFGFRGPTLIAGSVDTTDCTRCTAEAIDLYLTSIAPQLDIDLSGGSPQALTDGLLNLRWLFGFRGAALVNGAVNLDECDRCTAEEIDDYITSLNE